MDRLNADDCEQAFERLWLQSKRQPYMVKTTEAPHYRRYAIQLCKDVGLGDDLIGTNPNQRGAMVLSRGKLENES